MKDTTLSSECTLPATEPMAFSHTMKLCIPSTAPPCGGAVCRMEGSQLISNGWGMMGEQTYILQAMHNYMYDSVLLSLIIHITWQLLQDIISQQYSIRIQSS